MLLLLLLLLQRHCFGTKWGKNGGCRCAGSSGSKGGAGPGRPSAWNFSSNGAVGSNQSVYCLTVVQSGCARCVKQPRSLRSVP